MRHAAGLALLAAVIAGSAALRISLALGDPNFDHESPASLLRTDPALIYYVTERIVEAGGWPPDDFRSDHRIEYPDGTDIPSAFTVGQEFFVAWTYAAFGNGLPLHVFAVWAMGVFASLVAVGVYGLALELTRSVSWACFAALLWSLLLASYRTVGAILIREDFALPWFALHLYLLARAARVGTRGAWVLAGLSLLATVATWHAIGFVVLMEAACLLLWFLRTGENLPARGGAWIALAVAVVGSLCVPVLRAKQFALSLPIVIAAALVAGGRAARRLGWSRGGETAAVLGLCAALALAGAVVARLTGAGLADYSHVFELLLAKLRFLGQRPDDPALLSFGARLLWEGPFETADPQVIVNGFTTVVLVLVAAFVLYGPDWITGRGEPRTALLVAFCAAATLSAFLVQRTEVILAVASPVLAAVVFQRMRPPALARSLAALTVAFPAVVLWSLPSPLENPWYLPPEHDRELAAMKRWVAAHVPPGEPIATDMLNSAAILSHSRHPVLMQPKYETARSRDRIEAFYRVFFLGTPAELHRYLHDRGARYLVVDRHFLRGEAFIGGVRPERLDEPSETAASHFLSQDPALFAEIPGFRLLYRSPPELRYDSYRIYRLE